MCLQDDQTIDAEGHIQNSGGDHVCGTEFWGWSFGNPTNSSMLGTLWASDRWFWFGTLPFDGAYASHKIYLSCASGSPAIDYVDSSNDPIPGVTVSYTGTLCATPSGTITFGGASFDSTSCAGGNSGTPSIVVG